MSNATEPTMTASVDNALNTQQALDYLCAEVDKLGADAYDALSGESETLSLELFEGQVKGSEISHSRGLGLRLFRDRRPGYAFTERFTREAINQTVRDAWSHTWLTDPVEIELPGTAQLSDTDLRLFDPGLANVTFAAMKSFSLQMEEVARGLDKRIENIPYVGAGKRSGAVRIRNNLGVDYASRTASCSAGIGITAQQDAQKKMGSFSRGARRFEFDATEIATRAVERAVELLGASPIPSGTYPIVFSNRVAPQIFSMFSGAFFADAVHKGQSRLAGKMDQSIATAKVDIVSDPYVPEWPGSYVFDSEGVPARKLNVVVGGVLQCYLHNLESARRDGVEPTGNGARSYAGKAGTGFANYIVPRTQHLLPELLAAHPQCLYVVKLEGSSGCSAVSGEISIGVQGFFVRQGQIVQAVDRVTLSGNFFDLLTRIEMFSDTWSDSFSSVKVPDTLVAEMNVAG